MKTDKQIVGKIGEDIACEYYKNMNFVIKDRNYLRKWGELDIIATKDNSIFFIEVKTVTRSYICNNKNDSYQAEDNVHPYKVKRLQRTIQTYLLDNKYSIGGEWQFDLLVVILSKEDLSLININRIKNIIL